MKLISAFLALIATTQANPYLLGTYANNYNYHGSIGPSGVVTHSGASGPSGVVTRDIAYGPSGYVTAHGPVGPKDLHDLPNNQIHNAHDFQRDITAHYQDVLPHPIEDGHLYSGQSVYGSNYGYDKYYHGSIGPSGITTHDIVKGPSGIVTRDGAFGPSGVVTAQGAIGPKGDHNGHSYQYVQHHGLSQAYPEYAHGALGPKGDHNGHSYQYVQNHGLSQTYPEYAQGYTQYTQIPLKQHAIVNPIQIQPQIYQSVGYQNFENIHEIPIINQGHEEPKYEIQDYAVNYNAQPVEYQFEGHQSDGYYNNIHTEEVKPNFEYVPTYSAEQSHPLNLGSYEIQY